MCGMLARQRKSASRSRTFLKLPSWARGTNPSTLTQIRRRCRLAAVEPGGNHLNGFKDFRTQNGSSERHNLAVTVLYVRNSDSGGREKLGAGHQRPHAGRVCARFAQKRNGPSISGRPRLVVQIRQLWRHNRRETLEAAPPRKP